MVKLKEFEMHTRKSMQNIVLSYSGLYKFVCKLQSICDGFSLSPYTYGDGADKDPKVFSDCNEFSLLCGNGVSVYFNTNRATDNDTMHVEFKTIKGMFDIKICSLNSHRIPDADAEDIYRRNCVRNCFRSYLESEDFTKHGSVYSDTDIFQVIATKDESDEWTLSDRVLQNFNYCFPEDEVNHVQFVKFFLKGSIFGHRVVFNAVPDNPETLFLMSPIVEKCSQEISITRDNRTTKSLTPKAYDNFERFVSYYKIF